MAYTGNSIVDYLKSTGADSSYAARKKKAAELGISNYTGTAAQNTQMLNTLRNSSNPNAGTVAPAQTVTPTQTAADKKVSDLESQWGPLSPGYAEAIRSGTEADYLKNVDKLVANTPVSQNNSSSSLDLSGLSGINFNVSPTATSYTDPYADKINAALDKILGYTPTTYVDPYSDKMDAALDKILNYDLDSPYDVTTDPMYNPMKTQYEQAGQTAFNNQVGRLATLTGGRPSTAAVGTATAAQNQYANDFAANVLPTLVSQEMTRRQNTFNSLAQQLEALQGLSNTGYNRSRDLTEDTNANMLNQLDALTGLSGTSYNRYRDTVSDTGMANGQYTQSGKINQQAIEQNEQTRLANEAATIAAANYDNIQAYIDKLPANDPLRPYLQAERQKKIANEAAAKSEAAAQQYQDAMDMWVKSGKASAEVAAILGLPEGAKTADYDIDLIQAATSRMNAETTQKNSEDNSAENSLSTSQYLSTIKNRLAATDSIGTDSDGKSVTVPRYTRTQFEEWLASLPLDDKTYDEIVNALDLDNIKFRDEIDWPATTEQDAMNSVFDQYKPRN